MMESNLLLEQYGKFKKAELEESPFRCLLDTNIEINPHQINAFCAAIQALKTGGIVLADEVGLGKTIEAGLTLKYVLDSGAKRVLIALPATLRKQWEIELEEKFGLESTILDRFTVESEPTGWKTWLEDKSKVRIVLASYDYSSKLMKRFPNVKWDFIIIDEAHNLRNVFHGTKRAKRLYDLSQGIPKILLTATPLQNTLSDLHGLISFIDPRIFGSEKVFNKRFIEGTKSANAQDGFDLFWEFVEDEIDESGFEEIDDEDTAFQKQQIQAEIDEVNAIIETASRIQSNAKIKALKTAIHTAFEYQEKQGIPQKVVVFTESKRTQKYIASELRKDGFDEDDILLFNGDFNDAMTKEIYRAWKVKNFGKTNYGRGVEYKHAIVDYFKEHSRILIVTDAGSEGLNLQFCNTVINYDLPWNPQKIEQRIGRCHRYGQKHDVVAINLLNTGNEADRRVYEILSKKFELFDGVFGASDIALGALESGSSFEKTILDIYQHCGTRAEFKKAFDKLDRQLDAKRNKKAIQLRSILMTESTGAKGAALEKTKKDIDRYLREVDYWSQVADPEVEGKTCYWKIDNWGEQTFGSHGTLFVGAFCKSNCEMLFPVLLLCDEQGRYIDFTEDDIIGALEAVDDGDVRYFKPTDEEMAQYRDIYDTLVKEMLAKYQAASKPVMDYNRRKVENWADIQREQLNIQIAEMTTEIEQLSAQAAAAKDFLQKIDIRKKVEEKKKQLQKAQTAFHQKVSSIQAEAEREISDFNQQFDIQPILLVNVVLKF